jgi:acetyl esterase/lipase
MRMQLNLALFFLFAVPATAQTTAPANPDSATFDPDGTAHITRVVPMPATISPEARQWLKDIEGQQTQSATLAERRAGTERWQKSQSAEAKRLFPVSVEPLTIAGVQTDIITPLTMPEENKTRLLINLHGGGFNSDSGSLIEGIPICNLAKIKVVSVYYRLAPENPFPAAVDDVVAVYKELLKTYKPRNIGIFGTSAGGILTAEVTVKLKQIGLPLPGALGLFTMLADFSHTSDSQQLFALNGLGGGIAPQEPNGGHDDEYVGKTDRRDPVLSPLFADLHGFPPSLLVTGTRDALLSSTTIFHLALLRAGVDAQLLVFEAMPHAFWYHFQIPETTETLSMMAKFFDDKLGAETSDERKLGSADNATVAKDVRAFMQQVAHDITHQGPSAWRRHFADSPSFFMAVNGQMAFPDSATATTVIHDLSQSMKSIELHWGDDLRVDPLTADLAVVATSYHEVMVFNAGQRMDGPGFFTAVVEHRDGRWQFRDVHWSVAVPPPAGH